MGTDEYGTVRSEAAESENAPMRVAAGTENSREAAAQRETGDLFGAERGETPEGNTRQFSERENGKKDERRFEAYLAKRVSDGTLNASAGDLARIREFYRAFPLNKRITNRWGENIVFAPEDPAKVDDYIQHFAVKRGGGIEKFSENHRQLFASIEEALTNPDERILTETPNGDRRICFTKRIESNGNHFVVTAISENGRLLAWTHMNASDNYLAKQHEIEKRCVEKYGVVDRDGKKMVLRRFVP